jgi:alpha-L-fucosidase 2
MIKPFSTSRSIWYDQPAGSDWNRALPLGTGRLGAMVFGNVTKERVQLNEDSVWSGGPRDRCNPDTLRLLPEIRRLIGEGKLAHAHDLAADALAGTPDIMRYYEPLADMVLTVKHDALPMARGTSLSQAEEGFADDQNHLAPTYYRRWLNLETATAGVSYTLDGTTYQRDYFASAVDGVIAIRLTADRGGAVSFTLRLDRGEQDNYASRYFDTIKAVERSGLILSGRTAGEEGIRFSAAALFMATGGSVTTVGDTVIVQGADSVLIGIAGASSYREADPPTVALTTARKALNKGWDALVAAHVAEYRSYFDRVALRLGGEKEAKDHGDVPTDRRLEQLRQGAEDSDLFALYFDFGRYLLIASSRPGSLPATLQGIWNQDFSPAWGSKYTININTQMNYWPAEVCNLSECHFPLFDLLERMVPSGTITATKMYGCRGFVAHHNTDIWADTCPTDRNLGASYWLMGGAWLALHPRCVMPHVSSSTILWPTRAAAWSFFPHLLQRISMAFPMEKWERSAQAPPWIRRFWTFYFAAW